MESPRAAFRPAFGAAAAAFVLLILLAPSLASSSAGSSAPSAPVAHPSHRAPAPLATSGLLIPRRVHPIPHAASPLFLGVDPYQDYSAEPAPMGIADYGVNASDVPYVYNTSAFLGTIAIRQLQVLNNSDFDPAAMTIQLNIVLTFLQGGAWYYYWIQDVAYIETSSNTVAFENNIWNFSSGSGAMDSNSVEGNGSVNFGEYYAASASTQAGNDITLTYPTTISLLAVATTSANRPEVDFEYRDGDGWQTYDNAIFPFATGASYINYTVNGTGYNPLGLYNDAELTLGGPGGGAETNATSANLTMSLQYYNGENYQTIPNAYDFGGDTAEAMMPLVSSLSVTKSNGTLADHLVFGHGGKLDQVYDRSQDAIVNIQTLVVGGDLRINGTTPIPFGANPVNVTLAPGNYSFAIYSGATLKAETNVTLTGGEFLQLFLAAGTVSTVSFNETGLPAGHPWVVTLGPFLKTSRGSSLAFPVINATYGWRVSEIPGYRPNATHGTINITGTNVSVLIVFTIVTYPVTLTETGLPENTLWGLVVDNTTFTTNGAFLHFVLPNGSFPYHFTRVPGFIGAHGPRGSLSINGLSYAGTVGFTVFTFNVSVSESGLGAFVEWGIDVGGRWENGSVPKLSVAQPNGTYVFHVQATGGWIANQTSGIANVANATVAINVTFVPFLYDVEFEESGLSAGTVWSVNVSGNVASGDGPNLSLSLGNATYPYQIDPVLGYTLDSAPTGNLTISGADRTVPVRFSAVPTEFGQLELTVSPTSAQVFLNGTLQVTTDGTLDLPLAVGPHYLQVTALGYHPFFDNLTIVQGARTVLPVTLVPLSSHHSTGTTKPTGPGSPSSGALGFVTSPEGLGLLGFGVAAVALLGWAASRRRSGGAAR